MRLLTTLRLPYPGRARGDAHEERLGVVEQSVMDLQTGLDQHRDHVTAELVALGGDMKGTAEDAVSRGLGEYHVKVEAAVASGIESFHARQWETVAFKRLHDLLVRLVKWVRGLFVVAVVGVGGALWHSIGTRLVDHIWHFFGWAG